MTVAAPGMLRFRSMSRSVRIDATIFIPRVLAKGMEGQQVQAVLIQVGALCQPVCKSCFHNSFEIIIRLYPAESSETCSASSRQSCPNFCSPDSPKKSFAGTQGVPASSPTSFQTMTHYFEASWEKTVSVVGVLEDDVEAVFKARSRWPAPQGPRRPRRGVHKTVRVKRLCSQVAENIIHTVLPGIWAMFGVLDDCLSTTHTFYLVFLQTSVTRRKYEQQALQTRNPVAPRRRVPRGKAPHRPQNPAAKLQCCGSPYRN